MMAVSCFQLPVPGPGRILLAALFVLGFAALLGCVAPKPAFYDCCMYGNASEGRCILANGTEYEVHKCDLMEDMACNVTIGEEDEVLPVCPKNELLKCSSNCVGMFCGSFDFDPRPPMSLDAEDVNSSQDGDDMGKFGGLSSEGGKGLYQGECRLLNMSPATLRAVTNTNGGFALNSFRFGVGNSFSDFDEAMMYYPLTDYSCKINEFGTVDRYTNYAIPNKLASGSGRICSPAGGADGRWICIPAVPGGGTIWSYSYFDCATKCMLAYAGDYAGIDPYSAYLTERNGRVLGNPFAYGYAEDAGDLREMSAFAYEMDKDYKASAIPSGAFADDYASGFNYYGAEFEKNDWPMGKDRGGIALQLVALGGPTASTRDIYDYYAERESELITLEWPRWGSEDGTRQNLITVERDPHLMYAFLLTHHSVYANQFKDGHHIANGSWAPGAEFECTLEGQECLSGFCNIFDYKRGVCFRSDGAEVPCDCWYDYYEGGVVCEGRKSYETPSLDDPARTIRATATLAAPVETTDVSGAPYADAFYQSPMPSKGKMVKFPLNQPKYISSIASSDESDEDVPFLVILLGGNYAYPIMDDYAPEARGEDLQQETLTISQVLSAEKWRGCSGQCGKFYTTFVEECAPTFEEDPQFYDDAFSVCYSPGSPPTGTRGQYLDAETGILKEEDWNCQGLYRFDQERPEGKRTGGQVYCYEWDADGNCRLYSTAALAIKGKEITYINEEGVEQTSWAFGKCLADENGVLRTKTYGYCDQCSYLTIAKDRVVALPEEKSDPGYVGTENREDNKYCPSLLMKTIYGTSEETEGLTGRMANDLYFSYNGQFGEWESGGVHRPDEDYSQCEMPDGSEVGDVAAWPDYLPNAYYLKSKLQDYLQRNIMPVLFADDEGLYRTRTSVAAGEDLMLEITFSPHYESIDKDHTTHPVLVDLWKSVPSRFEEYAMPGDSTWAYSARGTYLTDSVMDLGAGIIVIKNLSTEFLESGDIGEDVTRRSYAVKLLCPNCMVAVAAGYEEGAGSQEEKMKLVSQLFKYGMEYGYGIPRWDDYSYNLTCGTEIMCNKYYLEDVDVVAVDWTLSAGNSHCEIEDEQERFDAILADEMQFGSRMLKRFGKPVVVTDFRIIRNFGLSFGGIALDCWDDNSSSRFMEYLGGHTEDLIRSGHIGVIYSDWTSPYSGEEFATAIRTEESGVSGYRGPFYEGTLLAARGFSGYGEMNSLMEIPVKENCTCVPCTPTDPAEICNGGYGGTGALCGWEGERISMKWPDNCISEEACMPLEEIGNYKMDCVVASGGENVAFTVDGAEIAANPDLYKQMIASLQNVGERPCFQNKTFGMKKISRFLSHPMLFRRDGNLSYTCNPLSVAEGTLCSYLPSLDMESMECILTEKESWVVPLPGRLPPLGGGLPFGG